LKYLNDCYNLMDEIWEYKRTFEGVDEFWYRIYIEPAQRALMVGQTGKSNQNKNKRRCKKKKKYKVKSK